MPIIAVLFLAGWWTVNAQLQKTAVARQAWEYKNMVFIIDSFDRQTFYEDGRQLSGSPVPLTRIPELGADGWELISVTSTSKPVGNGSSSSNVYWLKRPK